MGYVNFTTPQPDLPQGHIQYLVEWIAGQVAAKFQYLPIFRDGLCIEPMLADQHGAVWARRYFLDRRHPVAIEANVAEGLVFGNSEPSPLGYNFIPCQNTLPFKLRQHTNPWTAPLPFCPDIPRGGGTFLTVPRKLCAAGSSCREWHSIRSRCRARVRQADSG